MEEYNIAVSKGNYNCAKFEFKNIEDFFIVMDSNVL